jgi:hypothetical protein
MVAVARVRDRRPFEEHHGQPLGFEATLDAFERSQSARDSMAAAPDGGPHEASPRASDSPDVRPGETESAQVVCYQPRGEPCFDPRLRPRGVPSSGSPSPAPNRASDDSTSLAERSSRHGATGRPQRHSDGSATTHGG